MGFTDSKVKELQFRSFLMTILTEYIKEKGLTQKEAAKELNATQSRISNLVHGKIDLFSSSMLLNMLEKAGFPIYENIQKYAPIIFSHVVLSDEFMDSISQKQYKHENAFKATHI